jgi:hypothetical protein
LAAGAEDPAAVGLRHAGDAVGGLEQLEEWFRVVGSECTVDPYAAETILGQRDPHAAVAGKQLHHLAERRVVEPDPGHAPRECRPGVVPRHRGDLGGGMGGGVEYRAAARVHSRDGGAWMSSN